METLQSHAWPGNVREMLNIIEFSMISCSGGALAATLPDQKTYGDASGVTLEEITRRHILKVLDKTGWRVAGKNGAAKILGLKRSTLQAEMKKLGIERPSV